MNENWSNRARHKRRPTDLNISIEPSGDTFILVLCFISICTFHSHFISTLFCIFAYFWFGLSPENFIFIILLHSPSTKRLFVSVCADTRLCFISVTNIKANFSCNFFLCSFALQKQKSHQWTVAVAIRSCYVDHFHWFSIR